MNAAQVPTFFFERDLQLDLDSGVWSVKGSPGGIGYTSDPYARSRLLRVIEAARDLGSMSPELHAAGQAWPARYYLSAERCNLLRPFDWNRDARVLEVGSGCGTITRYLGETFREVVAVEGEHHRALVGAARSRDQDNVAVVCAPLQDLSAQAAFDLVFCIGVLEYAPLFSDSADPLLEMLQSLRQRVGPTGALVLAIENKLGLKYFAGAAEDHTGIRYDGLEGYRRSGGRGPRTVGKKELTDLLSEAGFTSSTFYFPFPDYKFPSALATERALESGDPQVPEFIGNVVALDYQSAPAPLQFEQRAAWHQLARNGLAGDLANSFLVIASGGDGQNQVSAGWDMAAYRMSPRKPEFWTEARVRGLGTPSAQIERNRLLASTPSEPLSMHERSTETWYPTVTVGQLALDAAASRDATPEDVAQELRPWLELLQSSANGAGELPGSFIDVIPQNVVLSAGRPVAIDKEWIWHEPLPLHAVVSRGLAVLYSKLWTSPGAKRGLRSHSGARLIIDTARALGLSYGWREFRKFSQLQGEMTVAVQGSASDRVPAFVRLNTPPRLAYTRHRISQASAVARRVPAGIRRRIRR